MCILGFALLIMQLASQQVTMPILISNTSNNRYVPTSVVRASKTSIEVMKWWTGEAVHGETEALHHKTMNTPVTPYNCNNGELSHIIQESVTDTYPHLFLSIPVNGVKPNQG